LIFFLNKEHNNNILNRYLLNAFASKVEKRTLSGEVANSVSSNSLSSKIKALMKHYGFLAIGTYIILDIISLTGFYVLVKSGVDVEGLLESVRKKEKLYILKHIGYLKNSLVVFYF
jgi:3-methyladenine DNA glycosylase Tag